MYACFFIPVTDCTCVLCCRSWAAQPAAVTAKPKQFSGLASSPVLFTGRWLEVVTTTVFQTRARFYDTFTSYFVEWRSRVLWVLERLRARSSCRVCCKGLFGNSRWEWEWVNEWYNWRRPGASPLSRSTVFCHTVTLPLAVWQTIRWPHPVQVLIAMTTDARYHRPYAAHPMKPAVRFVAVIYYVIATMHLLLYTCCLSLAVFFVTFSDVYYVIDSFSLFTC